MQTETAQDESAFERIRTTLQYNAALHSAVKELLRLRRWPLARRVVVDAVAKTTSEYGADEPEDALALVEELVIIGVLVVDDKRDWLLLAHIRALEDLLLPPKLPPSVKPSAAGSAQAKETRRKTGKPRRTVPRLLPEPVMILAEFPDIDPFKRATHLLRTLDARNKISWPLPGKKLGDLLAACVGEAEPSERPQTYRLMRDLVRDGILTDDASSGWYHPGPNFRVPSMAIKE